MRKAQAECGAKRQQLPQVRVPIRALAVRKAEMVLTAVPAEMVLEATPVRLMAWPLMGLAQMTLGREALEASMAGKVLAAKKAETMVLVAGLISE